MAKTNHNAIAATAERLLGVKLTRHQRRILQAVMRSRRVAIASCHGLGKSFVLAVLAIVWAAMYDDARVLILTPGWLMNRAVIWSEIDALLARAAHRLPIVSRTQTELRFGPKNLVIGLSAADSGRLQGHHSEHLLTLCDEVSALDPSFFPAIEGLLATGDSRLVISGNPIIASGPLHDAFTRNRANWETIQVGAFDTENFEGVDLEALLRMSDEELDKNRLPFLVTKRWARERFDDWFHGDASNSPLWQSRVLGQFPSASSSALIPINWLERARRPAVDNGGELICGIDPSGAGKDLTSGMLCAGGAIVSSRTSAASDSRGEMLEWLSRYSSRIRIVYYDSCGLGYFYAEPLREAGYKCEGINVATAAKDNTRYANLKGERYWNLRTLFEQDKISGLDDPTFTELAAVQWLVNSKGLIEIESKESVRASLGHSPDRCESLMLCLGGGQPVPYEYRGIPRGSVSVPGSPAAPRDSGATWDPTVHGFVGPPQEEAEVVGRVRSRWDWIAPPLSGRWARQRGF